MSNQKKSIKKMKEADSELERFFAKRELERRFCDKCRSEVANFCRKIGTTADQIQTRVQQTLESAAEKNLECWHRRRDISWSDANLADLED